MLCVQERAIVVNLELTWQYLLSEFRPEQTKAACVNQVDLSPWTSMANTLHARKSYSGQSRAHLAVSTE